MSSMAYKLLLNFAASSIQVEALLCNIRGLYFFDRNLSKIRPSPRLQMMRLYATTLFLPSPAVPYVSLSLFIATRWKPLPPHHSCDTQAHQSALFAPAPKGPSLRGVILPTSIFAHTIPSVSLIDSPRFQIYPYAGGLCHSRIVPDCLADLPQFQIS